MSSVISGFIRVSQTRGRGSSFSRGRCGEVGAVCSGYLSSVVGGFSTRFVPDLVVYGACGGCDAILPIGVGRGGCGCCILCSHCLGRVGQLFGTVCFSRGSTNRSV